MTKLSENCKRIITFGASVVYGIGLDDCPTPEPLLPPSKNAWPMLLSAALDIPVVNASYPGSANARILLYILNFKFTEGDVVIIDWSSPLWSLLFQDTGFPKTIRPSGELSGWAGLFNRDNYYKIHNEYDLGMESLISIHHANQYLRNKKVQIINVNSWQALTDFINATQLPFMSDINITMMRRNDFWIDFAKDKLHPYIKSHARIAKYFYDQL